MYLGSLPHRLPSCPWPPLTLSHCVAHHDQHTYKYMGLHYGILGRGQSLRSALDPELQAGFDRQFGQEGPWVENYIPAWGRIQAERGSY